MIKKIYYTLIDNKFAIQQFGKQNCKLDVFKILLYVNQIFKIIPNFPRI